MCLLTQTNTYTARAHDTPVLMDILTHLLDEPAVGLHVALDCARQISRVMRRLPTNEASQVAHALLERMTDVVVVTHVCVGLSWHLLVSRLIQVRRVCVCVCVCLCLCVFLSVRAYMCLCVSLVAALSLYVCARVCMFFVYSVCECVSMMDTFPVSYFDIHSDYTD
jgi:hypothetical protein